MSEYTLADYLFDDMEADGFHYVGFSGRIGEEILTFKNDAGEIRTVEHGFTSAKPKRNFHINLTKSNMPETIKPKEQ